MIQQAYDIIEEKVNEVDQQVQNQFGERLASIFQKKYNSLHSCLEPLKHSKERQYVECLKKYGHYELNIEQSLKIHKSNLYTCVNTAYAISQKPQKYQPEAFDFMSNVKQCTNEFSSQIIKTLEKDIALSEKKQNN